MAGLESGSTQGVSTLLLPLLLSFLVQLRLQNLVELIELDGLAELDELAEIAELDVLAEMPLITSCPEKKFSGLPT